MPKLPLLQLLPEYRSYVWGGNRLRPGEQTAEAWVVHESDRILDGPFDGRTLAELAAEFGGRLLGKAVFARSGARFPLLVKLLDCAQWLSVQVHPNDEQAIRLEGPGKSGKTEAWHILAAGEGASLIAGLKPGVTAAALAEAIRSGTVVAVCQPVSVQAGETVFIRAGAIHALGPGLLVYEVQQSSDLTYRVFDWNRPLAAGRSLHIEKSLAVADPTAEPRVSPPAGPAEGIQERVACEHFRLELAQLGPQALDLNWDSDASFRALTVIEGSVQVRAGAESCRLARFQTVLVPAELGGCQMDGQAGSRILIASIPN
jgi:mannose-6-phosphate isomerase